MFIIFPLDFHINPLELFLTVGHAVGRQVGRQGQIIYLDGDMASADFFWGHLSNRVSGKSCPIQAIVMGFYRTYPLEMEVLHGFIWFYGDIMGIYGVTLW